jgi:hypothetical protein
MTEPPPELDEEPGGRHGIVDHSSQTPEQGGTATKVHYPVGPRYRTPTLFDERMHDDTD